MSTAKAVIRKGRVNSKNECVVYIRYGHKQKTIDFTTGVKVPISKFDVSKGIVNSVIGLRKNKSNEGLIEKLTQSDLMINNKIKEVKAEISSIAVSLQVGKKDPDIFTIKSIYLEGNDSESTDLAKSNLITLINEFISKSDRSDGTKEKYRNAVYHLEEFEKYQKKKIAIGDVDLHLYDDLVYFLFNDYQKQDKTYGLETNTVGTTIKNLKVFLKHLTKRGYPIPNILTDFKVPRVNVPIYFLTEEEIGLLESYEFESKRLTQVRDVFVFNCYVGLRYSDLERLRKDHIIDDVIEMIAYKNQNEIYAPLLPESTRILEKYDYKLPIISEQKYNDYLKEVCELAEINKEVEVIKTKSGNKTYEYPPKWQLISSHIAVKTFISLCGKKGISAKVVSEITGKSVQVILKHYYGIDKKTIKEQVKSAFAKS